MSACREFRDDLSAHLDGALGPAEAATLEAHLAQCPACREALEGLRATVARIRSVEPVEPPPWLEERILARVGRPVPWTRRLLSLAARPEMQAAALVLVCFTGFLVMKFAGPRRGLTLSAPLPETPPRVMEQEAAPPSPRALEKRVAPAPQPAKKKAVEQDTLSAPQEGVPPPPPANVAPAPKAAPSAGASAGAARERETYGRDEAKAGKAEFMDRASLAPAPAQVAFRLEAPDPSGAERAVLEALRQCGGVLLQQRNRSAMARVDTRRLAALRSSLEKVGPVAGTVPEDLPPTVVVTISW